MWSFENVAKLDLSCIGKSFKMTEQDGLILVKAKKNLWDWNPGERFLRSVVVDKNGYVVSCSWPKFGNYGEFLEDTEILKKDLQSSIPVNFTQKEDGTLCIRYCYNNKVFMRTRGTLFGGERGDDGSESFREKFFRVAESKYPKLLDPNWMNDRSLLFEYVAPDNLVVVRYTSEDLIFIGYVDRMLNLGRWEDMKHITKEGGLNLVQAHKLPTNPNEILKTIKDWKTEGVVARCNNGQRMIKIKSAYYLAQHGMKYSMNYRFMVEFAELANIKSEAELVNELKKCGYDYEIIQIALPFYYRYQKISINVDNIINKASELLNTINLNDPDPVLRRKKLAMAIINENRLIKSFLFMLYDNKTDKIKALRKKVILNENST